MSELERGFTWKKLTSLNEARSASKFMCNGARPDAQLALIPSMELLSDLEITEKASEALRKGTSTVHVFPGFDGSTFEGLTESTSASLSKGPRDDVSRNSMKALRDKRLGNRLV